MPSAISPRLELKILYESGIKSVKSLVNMTGYNLQHVYRLIRQIKSGEDISVKKKKVNPINFATEDMQRLRRQALANPLFSNERLAWKVYQLGSPLVSKKTIASYLRKLKIDRSLPKVRPLNLQKHRDARLELCTSYKGHDFDKTIFTDETSVQLYQNKRKMLHSRTKKPIINRNRRSPTIMFWCMISKEGRHCVRLRGKVNSQKYCDMIRDVTSKS